MKNKSESLENTEFDDKVISIMKKYGKKIKEYQLIEALKNEFACSELDVKLSLERLLKKEKITITNSDYYIISELS